MVYRKAIIDRSPQSKISNIIWSYTYSQFEKNEVISY